MDSHQTVYNDVIKITGDVHVQSVELT